MVRIANHFQPVPRIIQAADPLPLREAVQHRPLLAQAEGVATASTWELLDRDRFLEISQPHYIPRIGLVPPFTTPEEIDVFIRQSSLGFELHIGRSTQTLGQYLFTNKVFDKELAEAVLREDKKKRLHPIDPPGKNKSRIAKAIERFDAQNEDVHIRRNWLYRMLRLHDAKVVSPSGHFQIKVEPEAMQLLAAQTRILEAALDTSYQNVLSALVKADPDGLDSTSPLLESKLMLLTDASTPDEVLTTYSKKLHLRPSDNQEQRRRAIAIHARKELVQKWFASAPPPPQTAVAEAEPARPAPPAAPEQPAATAEEERPLEEMLPPLPGKKKEAGVDRLAESLDKLEEEQRKKAQKLATIDQLMEEASKPEWPTVYAMQVEKDGTAITEKFCSFKDPHSEETQKVAVWECSFFADKKVTVTGTTKWDTTRKDWGTWHYKIVDDQKRESVFDARTPFELGLALFFDGETSEEATFTETWEKEAAVAKYLQRSQPFPQKPELSTLEATQYQEIIDRQICQRKGPRALFGETPVPAGTLKVTNGVGLEFECEKYPKSSFRLIADLQREESTYRLGGWQWEIPVAAGFKKRVDVQPESAYAFFTPGGTAFDFTSDFDLLSKLIAGSHFSSPPVPTTIHSADGIRFDAPRPCEAWQITLNPDEEKIYATAACDYPGKKEVQILAERGFTIEQEKGRTRFQLEQWQIRVLTDDDQKSPLLATREPLVYVAEEGGKLVPIAAPSLAHARDEIQARREEKIRKRFTPRAFGLELGLSGFSGSTSTTTATPPELGPHHSPQAEAAYEELAERSEGTTTEDASSLPGAAVFAGIPLHPLGLLSRKLNFLYLLPRAEVGILGQNQDNARWIFDLQGFAGLNITQAIGALSGQRLPGDLDISARALLVRAGQNNFFSEDGSTVTHNYAIRGFPARVGGCLGLRRFFGCVDYDLTRQSETFATETGREERSLGRFVLSAGYLWDIEYGRERVEVKGAGRIEAGDE